MNVLRAPFALAAVACAACSSFEETHYFKSGGNGGAPPNYYRVDISGWTALSSSRYISGYFDESVVDQYFNEFSQPKDGALQGAPGNAEEEKKQEGSRIRPLGADGGKSLVLILSSNSDVIAEQIGLLAESEQIQQDLSRLVNRDGVRRATKAARAAKATLAENALLADLGDRTVGAADAPATAQAARQRMLEWAGAVAAQHGRTEPFTTLAQAAAWVRENRGRLVRE